MSAWVAVPPPSQPAQSRTRVGGLTGLLRTPWQLKSQTHGPSSESSSQTPPRCRHRSCSHSPSSPEPEPPEPHSAEGRGPAHPGVLGQAGAQRTIPVAPEPTLLTGPCPGLLDPCLLLAGGLTELACAAVGDAVGAAHGAGQGVLTAGTDTLPSQAQGPEGTYHVSAGLYRGWSQAGVSGPSWGTHGATALRAPTAPLTAGSGGSHMQADLVCAGMDMQLALAGIRVPVRAAHGLGQGHALRGTHTAPSLSLAQGSKAAVPAAIWGGGSVTAASAPRPLGRPACPALTTGSSARHPDLPPEGAGCGLQLARAGVCGAVAAAHRVVDARTRLLARTLGLAVLHSTHCPKRALHPEARGPRLVCENMALSGLPPLGRRTKPPAPRSRPLSGRGRRRQSGPGEGPDAQDTAEKGTDTWQMWTGTQTQPAPDPCVSAEWDRPQRAVRGPGLASPPRPRAPDHQQPWDGDVCRVELALCG